MIRDRYSKLPLSFEANHGQTDSRVKFVSRGTGYSLFLTGDEAVLALRGPKVRKSSSEGLKPVSLNGSDGTAKTVPFPDAPAASRSEDVASTGRAVLRMKFRNANPAANVTGIEALPGTANYFIGDDPSKWQINVPTYAKVKYEGIYPGIDLVFYGNERQLEYDFIVAPGADPRRIGFDTEGAKRIRRDAQGNIAFQMNAGGDVIHWRKPIAYQKKKDGTRRLVEAHYSIIGANRLAFEVAAYDARQTLYIDPVHYTYSTFLGGSGNDQGYGVAFGPNGSFVTGSTTSTDFPVTAGAIQTTNSGTVAFVSKIANGLVYSTYLGGTSGAVGRAIAVDSAGNAYVTGGTGPGFPTLNALQSTYGGNTDAFVAELNSTGTALLYSTYLGGSGPDYGYGIALDSANNAHVTGYTGSSNFPTHNALQSSAPGGGDAFVTKINPAGSAFVYSTYLGGGGTEQGSGIAVDSSGNAYVTGATSSSNFPVTTGAFQTSYGGGGSDFFVTKINPDGSALVYSTYLGGDGIDSGFGIALDSAGNAYVTGMNFGLGFPDASHPPRGDDQNNPVVAKLNPAGSALVFADYIFFGNGKRGATGTLAIGVDAAGNSTVTGTYAGKPNWRLFASEHDSTGTLLAGIAVGGAGESGGQAIAVSPSGSFCITGFTHASSFPITRKAFQRINAGGVDSFLMEASW
jgi:hypothetical protein